MSWRSDTDSMRYNGYGIKKIEPYFKETDFTKKELLLQGVFVLLMYARGKPIGKMAIERPGERHNRDGLNVNLDLYPIWIDCLIKTLTALDPQLSPSLET